MKIHIIGGGIIGLCSAWYLTKEGYEVTVIDKTDLSDGASHGNAGMIVPSHFIPMATPGVIAKGIRWMFDAKSPFFIRPRLSLDLIQWLWKFYRSCNHDQVARAIPLLRDFNVWSRDLYTEFAEKEGFQCEYEKKGLLMLYREVKSEKEEKEVAEKAYGLGMKAEILSASAVQEMEPGIQLDVRGGIFYPGDTHLYPSLFIQEMVRHLKAKGVTFLTGKTVTDFKIERDKVSGIGFSAGEIINADRVVLAAGSWSAMLLKKLGIRMLLQDGRGYSVTLKKPGLRPSIPTILTEAKVAVTPMGNDLRIGGTLEISNFSTKINQKRLAGILESVPRYYPELSVETPAPKDVWQGYRPCTPDGMPYIGRSDKFKNLTIATGHAMMGMSLGPATGKLVTELISGKKPTLETALFGLNRF